MTFNIPIEISTFAISFFLTLISGFIVLPLLRKLKFGETIREDGPKTHFAKAGTPSMGGIIFLIPMFFLCIITGFKYKEILPMIALTIGCSLIGFIDDYIKIVKKDKKGLNANKKMAALVIIGVVYTVYLMMSKSGAYNQIIPFLGIENPIQVNALVYFLIVMLVFLASTNSVNLSDGLDGLDGGMMLIVMVFFTIIAMKQGEWSYVKIFTSLCAGACLGFLAFNIHPAKVFMGDTGSLALGGALASVVCTMDMPLILLIAGGVFVMVTLSVIIQVLYFKKTGKRVFKMAPIHHHFELSGWKETKIVYLFWSVTVILCIISYFAL